MSEEVQVIGGPYAGMKCRVEEVNCDKVKVAINIFGRDVPAELRV